MPSFPSLSITKSHDRSQTHGQTHGNLFCCDDIQYTVYISSDRDFLLPCSLSYPCFLVCLFTVYTPLSKVCRPNQANFPTTGHNFTTPTPIRVLKFSALSGFLSPNLRYRGHNVLFRYTYHRGLLVLLLDWDMDRNSVLLIPGHRF